MNAKISITASRQLRDQLFTLLVEADFPPPSKLSKLAPTPEYSHALDASIALALEPLDAVPPGQYSFEGCVGVTKPSILTAALSTHSASVELTSADRIVDPPNHAPLTLAAAAAVPGGPSSKNAWGVFIPLKPANSPTTSEVSIKTLSNHAIAATAIAASAMSLSPSCSISSAGIAIGPGSGATPSPSSCWGGGGGGAPGSQGGGGSGCSLAERLKAQGSLLQRQPAKAPSTAVVGFQGAGVVGPRVVQQGFHPPAQHQQAATSRLKGHALAVVDAKVPLAMQKQPDKLTSLVLDLGEGGSLSGWVREWLSF